MIVPSIRALGLTIGMSHTMLNRHLKNGKFQAEPGGGFDSDKVKAALAQNSSIDQPSQSKYAKASAGDGEPSPVVSIHAEYNRLKAYREKLKAKREEMELQELIGELTAVEEVRKTWHMIGRMYAQARENVPSQIAPRLAGKTDLREIESLIRTAYREADKRVANEIQSRFANIVGNGNFGSVVNQ